MAKVETQFLAFNRGIISPLALARVDLKRAAWSCEEMRNWMPRAFGSMMLRPGLQYIARINNDAVTRNIAFVRSLSAKAIVELTSQAMRIMIDDAFITRASVGTAVTNGNFDTTLAGWTDNDESGASSSWFAGGFMGLVGSGVNAAIRDQTVTVAVADRNVEHALRIVVERGPVVLRVGTSTTDDSYINETELLPGIHSLAFTPTGDFNIRFLNREVRVMLVASCNIEAAGVMSITTPWTFSDLANIRGGQDSQSVDVMFVACTGYTQRRIERRAARSWSLTQYRSNDGPFLSENVGPITLTPSAIRGNITVTASAALFKSTHAPSTNNAGALFRITSSGQTVNQTATAQNTFTNAIRVTGVDASRVFSINVTGLSATGSTVTLQRSLESEDGPWTDVANYTTDQDVTYDDGLDNQIAWYRIGVKTGNYVAGTINMTLTYTVGSIDGVIRVTAFNSSTSIDAEVLIDLGGTSATAVWAEGAWSDSRGWPSSGTLYESRLWWSGLDKQWGSITDAYDSFDDSFEGDAGPISRSIGSGPVETINWMLPLDQLILGGEMAEFSCRSSALDEPLTPTNFNLKPSSTQGSAPVQAVQIDGTGVFVQRGGSRLFELKAENYKYRAFDLCQLAPEVCQPRITRVAIQRQPDTRIHCVLSDGTAAVLVYDDTEEVACWLKISTDGTIDDAVVLPGATGETEDRVYYSVARSINGATVRHIEKWALESECIGGTLNKQADAFVTFTNSPASTTVSGLTHLVGESVIVWQDGICPEDNDGFPKEYTVSASGTITLDTAATTGVVGLPYDAPWQSAKLGQTLNKVKSIRKLGVVLANSHPKGLYYGPTLTEGDMDTMPLEEEGEIVDEDEVRTAYDEEPFEFDGRWTSDARLCLKAYAPRPVTIMAATITGDVNG